MLRSSSSFTSSAVRLWVVFTLLDSSAVFIGAQTNAQVDRWDHWWSYQPGFSGPAAWGGGFNPQWVLCSKGKRQSPIDISPADLLYDSNLKHISLNKHKASVVLRNTGHDLTVMLDRDSHKIYLSDGPLSYNYRVEKVVVHFGNKDKHGSEHKIEGKSFPAEVQIYAYNSDLYKDFSEAEEANSGIAAISVLIALNDTVNTAVGQLFNRVPGVQYKGMESKFKFSVHDLLPDTRNYITYLGSLTRPGCYESVTWIIMNKPVYVTMGQMKLLRQTVSTSQGSNKAPLGDNYRPIQNVNRRALRTNINFPDQIDRASSISLPSLSLLVLLPIFPLLVMADYL